MVSWLGAAEGRWGTPAVLCPLRPVLKGNRQFLDRHARLADANEGPD